MNRRIALLVSGLLISLLAPVASAGAAPTSVSCIVSLSPSATQTLFAIGAGPQVKAVDRAATWPVGKLPPTRIDAFSPSAEAIAGICPDAPGRTSNRPDLVVISYNANSVKEKLHALGVRVIEQDAPANLSQAFGQMRQLGRVTGRATQANALVNRLRARIAADVRLVPPHRTSDVRVYYELDPTFYSATSATFVGSLLARLGVTNIADAPATSADAGYPQLNQEYILSANPTLVVLADTVCCGANATTVAARPGWSNLDAVRGKHILALNDTLASTWGPLLGTLMDQLAAAVSSNVVLR